MYEWAGWNLFTGIHPVISVEADTLPDSVRHFFICFTLRRAPLVLRAECCISFFIFSTPCSFEQDVVDLLQDLQGKEPAADLCRPVIHCPDIIERHL